MRRLLVACQRDRDLRAAGRAGRRRAPGESGKHNEGLGCLYLRALADVDSKASSNGWRAGCRAEAEGGRGAGRPGNRLAPTGREPWRPRRPRASEIDRPPRVSPRCVSRSR